MSAANTFHRGQALTEFLVLALALIPLLLLIPVVAKYQDMVHATELASRYVAFEAMTRNDTVSTWKTPEELAGEVRRRFFSNSEAPIKTGDAAGDFKAHQNLFWRDQRGAPLIKSFNDDVSVSFGTAGGAGQLDAFKSASDGAHFETGLLNVRKALELEAKGIYTANVNVVVANLPEQLDSYAKSYEQFKNINLTLTRSTSLLIDSWAAKGPEEVERRIKDKAIFPGVLSADAGDGIDPLVAAMEDPKCPLRFCVHGPQLGKLDFWRDVVPADRLK